MARRRVRQSKKGKLSSRSGKSWAGRGALALGLLVLGYVGTADSLARVVAKVDPARAHAISPGNGAILADYAQESFTRKPDMAAHSPAANFARQALLSDPTAAEALTVLGFQAQLRGDIAQSDRIFSYSTMLSRRELRPRIWAIENAVTRGDVSAALRNYDVALRTSRDAARILFPTLTAALSEPRIRAELLEILESKPVWEEDFVAYAARHAIEPEGTIALFSEGRQIGLKVTDDLRANLVNALVAQNKLDKAWAYYRSFRPTARRDQSRDPGFALQNDNPAVFDWRVGGDTNLAAAILRERDTGLLDFAVPPSVGGVLASQTQLLPSGKYRLEGRSRGLNQPENSQPYWMLACADGRELGRITVPNSHQAEGRFSGSFTVPQNCPTQVLSLMAQPSDDIMGVSGQIEQTQLIPAR